MQKSGAGTMTDYIYRGGRPAQPQAPALVMLHGAGMDHTVWTMLARYHARRGYNVIAPDLPGHGRSGGESLKSIAEMADWLELVLAREEALSPYLMGHSMGSLVALECAARLGDKCSGLGMFGTAFPMPVGPPLLKAAENNEQSAIDMICLFGHDTPAQLGGNPVSGVNVLNTGVRLMQSIKDDVLYNDLSACNNWQDGFDRAQQVIVPSTLVLGLFDKMTPVRSARELASQFSDCQTLNIESGHMMMTEAPEATHQALCQALKRCNR